MNNRRRNNISEISVEEGSGNVFADIGVKNPEEALIKAQIMVAISRLIHRLKLTQTQAARKLGIDQPKVSMLLSGRFRDFSIERLFRFLGALEQDIEIIVSPRKKSSRPKITVRHAA